MPDINIHNYESFLLDYFEGKLSDSQAEKLISFIYSDPELIDEFENSQKLIKLNPGNTNFSFKQNLYRQEIFSNNTSNFDELCIAKLEGDLTKRELEEFNRLLSETPNLNKDFSIFEKTVSTPDLSVRFENKDGLKQKQIVANSYSRFFYYSIAASIAVLFSILILTPENVQLNKFDQNAILYSNRNKIQPTNNNVEIPNTEKITNKIEGIKLNNTNIYETSNSKKVEDTSQIIFSPDFDKTQVMAQLNPVAVGISNNKSKIQFVKVTLPEMKDNTFYSDINNEETSLKSIVLETVNTQVLKKDKDLNKISAWDIAQLGINGINKITGSNIQLNKKYDNKGNLAKVEFDSKLFAFSTPVKK